MSHYNAETQDMTDEEFVQSIDKDKIFYKVFGPPKKSGFMNLEINVTLIAPTKYCLIVSIRGLSYTRRCEMQCERR